MLEIENLTDEIKINYSHVAKFIFPKAYQHVLNVKSAVDLDLIFFKLLERFEVRSLIECGANDASASLKAIQMGMKAIAIEANPITFDSVTPKETHFFSKLNLGLSDREGVLEFYIPKSLLTSGDATFKPKPGIEYDVSRIPVNRLDNLQSVVKCSEEPFSLWIDVEGLQQEVLLGAQETLENRNCIAVKIEVEEKEIFEGQSWFANDVIKFLDELGFSPIFRDFEYDSQYNILFIKNEKILEENQIKEQIFQEVEPITLSIVLRQVYRNVMYASNAKQYLTKIFGEHFADNVAAFFGSKSAKKKLK